MSESPTEPSRVPSEGLYEVLERQSVKMLIEISGGELSFLDKLFGAFLEHGDRAMLEFSPHLEAGDAAALADLAHKIKGASTQVGASSLAAICDDLEDRARSDRLVECVDLVERLVPEYARVRTALENFRQRSIEDS